MLRSLQEWTNHENVAVVLPVIQVFGINLNAAGNFGSSEYCAIPIRNFEPPAD